MISAVPVLGSEAREQKSLQQEDDVISGSPGTGCHAQSLEHFGYKFKLPGRSAPHLILSKRFSENSTLNQWSYRFGHSVARQTGNPDDV
jgi:hypothetical protein